MGMGRLGPIGSCRPLQPTDRSASLTDNLVRRKPVCCRSLHNSWALGTGSPHVADRGSQRSGSQLTAVIAALFWGAVLGFARAGLWEMVGAAAAIAAVFLWFNKDLLRRARDDAYGKDAHLTLANWGALVA